MSPTRRDYLRIGGFIATGAVAGCLSSARPTGDGSERTERTTERTETTDSLETATEHGDPIGGTRSAGTGGPGVVLASIDDAPDLPVAPAVEVVEHTATDEHPPRLRVTLTNEDDEPIRVGEGRAVLFAYVTDTTRDLVLLPGDGEYAAKPGCWRLTEPVATTMEYRTIELDSGESVSQDLDLYGTAGGDGCLPVGEHRFEAHYDVASGGTRVGKGEAAMWGFSLLLE